MKVIEWIIKDQNINSAIKAVKKNKGSAGIDKMPTQELDSYFALHREEVKKEILEGTYKPEPVRRVYIPKSNGKKRPLGIPTVRDRVVQQAIAQVLSLGYDKYFSENSYGFRPGRDCHQAINKALEYIKEGYEWVIDLDIEKYFDTVNHDKLITILREKMNDAKTLRLIRKFLQAGVMEEGLVKPSEEGVPQGGPLSPILSNVYLDKLDKELEQRKLCFVRYADDCNIFVKSERAANRVMKSITSWLERKLKLKVNVTKSKVVRPMRSNFLGFSFLKYKGEWKVVPMKDRKKKLYDKTRQILCRKRACARTIGETFKRLNWLIRGWINYYGIGVMSSFIEKYGYWIRRKVRVVILKQWKNHKRIYINLLRLCKLLKYKFTEREVYIAAYNSHGWYRRANHPIVRFTICPKLLSRAKEDRPGLIDPLKYYLSRA